MRDAARFHGPSAQNPQPTALMNHDDALVGAARAGDAAAFATLFDRYHPRIVAYLYRLTGDRDVADDLCQETFLRAFRALARTTPELQFQAWLYRIATNTARSWHRRRRLFTWLPFGSRDAAGPDEPAHDPRLADELGERELVHAALRRIGPAHASILLLRHEQQLTVEETADALGISPNTAKVRLYRARKAFASAWDALAEHDPSTTTTRGEDWR